METIAERIERKGIEIGLEEGKKIGIEKGIQQGIEQGIEQGEKIGIEKGIFKIAKNMLQKHVEIDFISAITGLSLEQIKALRTVLG